MIAVVENAAPAALSRSGTPTVAVARVIGGELIWACGFGLKHVKHGFLEWIAIRQMPA